jgi:putative lipase involved disintegration of autophagic bodies
MATQIDLALMAGAAYISTRPFDKNKFPIPDGWFEIPNTHQNDTVTGFEASRFTNGSEYVISFAGTYDKSAADLAADVNLGTGVIHDQLIQAAEYYLQVKASAPVGANITLTGHSLGGGLASLVVDK